MIDYEHRNTREYRYAYGVGNSERPPQDFQNRLVKVDVRDRDAETWGGADTYPGEPVFIPSPGDERDEDDGLLLSVVLDAEEGRSFLLVLDAATMDERARAWCPHPIPFGFHGQFYATGEERPTRSMA
jgi:carotenoid cleavage dioxygenase-like enzyme